jgi:hypothetical protein
VIAAKETQPESDPGLEFRLFFVQDSKELPEIARQAWLR